MTNIVRVLAKRLKQKKINEPTYQFQFMCSGNGQSWLWLHGDAFSCLYINNKEPFMMKAIKRVSQKISWMMITAVTVQVEMMIDLMEITSYY